VSSAAPALRAWRRGFRGACSGHANSIFSNTLAPEFAVARKGGPAAP
jgi:hypothetical protein